MNMCIRLVVGIVLIIACMTTSADAQLVNSEWATGNGAWNVSTNWLPNDVPDNGDGFTYNVAIGNLMAAHGAQVTFVPEDGTSDSILSLVISNTADLLTNGNQLVVLGQTTLDGAGSTIRVDAHNTPGTVAFSTNSLDLNNGGGLTMEGGIATINILFEVNTGTLVGHGTVNVGDGDLVVEKAFENSSLIQPSSNSAAPQTLVIRSNGVDTIDLDGDTENGVVDVSNALASVNADTVSLVIDGPLTDAFSGTLQIGQRDTLTFNDDITMDGANVQLNGGSQIATLNGAGNVTDIASTAFTITGDAVIANNLTFIGPANTLTVNASGSLVLNGAVSSGDASFLSLAAGSELVINGSLTIIEAGGDIDWDGTGNNATTTIGGSGLLSLNVDQIDVGNNIFNGTINLNDGGDLVVNNTINSWQAAGIVNKNGAGTSSISGDEFAVTGDLNVNAGTLDVNANAIFGSTSDVIIASGATASMATTEIHNGADITVNGTLSLGAASIIESPATLTGSGLFRLNSTSTIAADAVVNTATFDWDGTGIGSLHTINDGVVFTINSTTFDSDGDMDDPVSLGGNSAQLIVNGSTQWTMNGTLTANAAAAGTATIGGTSRMILAGTMNVDGSTTISAPLTFQAGSVTSIDAGITLNANGNTVYAGGTIGGLGFFNPGTTNTVTGNTLINTTNFNFDAASWTVQNNALLTINVTDYDPGVASNAFDLGINLSDGDISVTTADAEFVMDGVLNMSSTLDGEIVAWLGQPLDIGNDAGVLDADLNVVGTRQSQIAPEVDFNSDADVNVGPSSTLNFLSTVNFNTVNAANNAEFTGAGTIAFSGIVNVNEAVTLNMVNGTVDLDGLDNAGDFVNIDAPLVINAKTLASFGRNNGGGGVNILDINNSVGTGVLTVNLDDPSAEWTLNAQGVMNLVNDNVDAALLTGSPVNVNGTMNVTGAVDVSSRLDVAGVVNLPAGGTTLTFQGGTHDDPNRLLGGSITGAGEITAGSSRALIGHGSIATAIDFDGAGELKADDGMLTITGTILDVGIIGTEDADGILNIPAAWSSAVADFVDLIGGELRGGQITINNTQGITGHGLVSARIINNQRIRSVGGPVLVVETADNLNDWDGAGGAGQLIANPGTTLELRDNSTFGFTGTVSATGGGRVLTTGFGFNFNVGSAINLSAATYESTSSNHISGTVNIAAGGQSTLKVENNFFLVFEPGSSTTLNSNLRLINNNINIEAGATFSGAGALVVPDGSHLVMDATANADVLLIMDGGFRPANFKGVGRVDVKDYQQGPTADLFVELRGTAFNDYDRVMVNGSAMLAGRLEIDVDEVSPGVLFVPALGNTFNILSTTGVRSGEFDIVDMVVTDMPAGLTFYVDYLPNGVNLMVVNKPFYEADFDEDGDVDLTDYDKWRKAFGLNSMGDATGDGKTDAADYVIWRKQLGLGPLPPGAGSAVANGSAVPEPTTTTILVLVIALAGVRSRRPRSS